MKRKAGRIFDSIIKYELLLLAAAIPVLVLPRSYLWKWRQGLTAYAPLGDEAAPGLSALSLVADQPRHPPLYRVTGCGFSAAPP